MKFKAKVGLKSDQKSVNRLSDRAQLSYKLEQRLKNYPESQ
jgi:hypothetical protein